jgi:hypothetical protein
MCHAHLHNPPWYAMRIGIRFTRVINDADSSVTIVIITNTIIIV